MADRLESTLQRAGEVLDRVRQDAVSDAAEGRSHDDVILSLAPAPADAARRQPLVFGAAAAVLVVVALVAAIAVPRLRDDAMPVTSAGSTVALIPGDGVDGWDEVRAEVQVTDRGADLDALVDRAVMVPAADRQNRSRAVRVQSFAGTGLAMSMSESEGVEEVSGSGLTGSLIVDPATGSASLGVVVEGADGTARYLILSSGDEVTVDELFEIAAANDPTSRLGNQATAEGWEVLASYDMYLGATSHSVELNRSEPMTYDQDWQSIVTITGVSEEIMWLFVEPWHAVDVEVRGRPAWISTADQRVTLSWVEEPGTVVLLGAGSSTAGIDELVEQVAATAEDLVRADAARWEAFAAPYLWVDGNPVGGDGELSPTTTISASGWDGSMIAGQTAGGMTYDVHVNANGSFCWAIPAGQPATCDAEPYLPGRDGATPRWVPDVFDPVMIYGYLADGATRVEITVADRFGTDWVDEPTITGRAWFWFPDGGEQIVAVDYFDAAGALVESHEFG